MNRAQQEKLSTLISKPIQWQCRLDRYTSLAIGGPAEAVVKVEERQELQSLLAFLAEENVPWRTIGRGTNLVVKDEGYPGVILILGAEFKNIDKESATAGGSVIVQAGAAYALAQLAFKCMEWGVSGVEFGCGIPGSLGGAVIMNAGGWGSDMASVVESVRLMNAEGEVLLGRSELDFSYRTWKGFAEHMGKAVVVEVELELTVGNPNEIKEYCSVLQNRRKTTQPCEFPNAGSFFKNPSNDSAGRLIDSSGLKGVTVGGAMISEHHGNFLVNKGGATAEDVLNLMKMVQVKVKLDSGIDLEPEVHFI
ncbi:MAG: UDP-N-acetylmuramate dehydrogenase [Desulforhopalus sp.]